MKFRLYHPGFVTLDATEEKEYQKKRDVASLDDMVRILSEFRNVDDKSEYFVDQRKEGDMPLMEYAADGSWWVCGFVTMKDDETLPEQTAKWNNTTKSWEIKDGIPQFRY